MIVGRTAGHQKTCHTIFGQQRTPHMTADLQKIPHTIADLQRTPNMITDLQRTRHTIDGQENSCQTIADHLNYFAHHQNAVGNHRHRLDRKHQQTQTCDAVVWLEIFDWECSHEEYLAVDSKLHPHLDP